MKGAWEMRESHTSRKAQNKSRKEDEIKEVNVGQRKSTLVKHAQQLFRRSRSSVGKLSKPTRTNDTQKEAKKRKSTQVNASNASQRRSTQVNASQRMSTDVKENLEREDERGRKEGTLGSTWQSTRTMKMEGKQNERQCNNQSRKGKGH